ncbi:Homocysteine S-methyltransferase 1 [Diplonema papillatum]|nr:Homocysteine S-methyltransferase 1 [Diplonema papillatum]
MHRREFHKLNRPAHENLEMIRDAVDKIRKVEAWFNDHSFVVIDGGTGTEIEKEAGLAAMNKKGWSCYCNVTHPKAVKKVHTKYLEAGADIIIANTYATNPNVMFAAGFTSAQQEETTRAGCRLAREAVDDFMARHPYKRPLVAGSLSCHPPAMPEGAEFARGTWPEAEEEEANCRRHAQLLQEGGVDVIFLEMIFDLEHGLRAARAATSVGLPVFVAVCVPLPMTGAHTEEALRRLAIPGDQIILGGAGPVSVVNATRELMQYSNVIGINVHHTPLPFVKATVEAVRKAGWTKTIGVYPDHGTFKNPHWEALDLNPERFLRHCEDWVESCGVKAIGGCCGIGPDVIKRIHKHRPALIEKLQKYHRRKGNRSKATSPIHWANEKEREGKENVKEAKRRRFLLICFALFIVLQFVVMPEGFFPALWEHAGGGRHFMSQPQSSSMADAEELLALLGPVALEGMDGPMPTALGALTDGVTVVEPLGGAAQRSCEDYWVNLWYFMMDTNSDGALSRAEFASYLAAQPSLKRRLIGVFTKQNDRKGMNALFHVLDPQRTEVITLENFGKVWQSQYVGTPAEPCPVPARARAEKEKEKGARKKLVRPEPKAQAPPRRLRAAEAALRGAEAQQQQQQQPAAARGKPPAPPPPAVSPATNPTAAPQQLLQQKPPTKQLDAKLLRRGPPPARR